MKNVKSSVNMLTNLYMFIVDIFVSSHLFCFMTKRSQIQGYLRLVTNTLPVLLDKVLQ